MKARIILVAVFVLSITSGSCDFSSSFAKNAEPEQPAVNPLCPTEEDPKTPTVLPHPKDCSKFYKCMHGKAYPISCPQGLHWSTKLQRCDWPEVAGCDPSIPTTKIPEGTTPPATQTPPTSAAPTTEAPKKDPRCPVDEDPKTPTVLPFPNDCSKFYKCLNGVAYPVSCPAGLHWSNDLNCCDWPEVAKCDPKVKVPSVEQNIKTAMNKELLTTAIPATVMPTKPAINALCPPKEDPKTPTVLPYPNDCSKFYKCLNGRAYPISCPQGLHWSTKLQRCDWPEVAGCDPNVPTTRIPEVTTPSATPAPSTTAPTTEAPKKDPRCPKDEDPKTPTVLPFPNDCSKFYKCLNGVAYPVSCPAGLHWSNDLNRCDWPEVAKCDPKVQVPSVEQNIKTAMNKELLTTAMPTTVKPTGPAVNALCPPEEDPKTPTVLPYPNDCSKFYKCLNGRAYPISCPQGLHWSTKLQRCDWPEVAGCDPSIPTTLIPEVTTSSATSTPSTAAPTTEAPKKDSRCPEDEDPKIPTVLPFPNDCSKFYKCLNGIAYPVSCPAGLHWSNDLNRCDWPEVAKCDPKLQMPSTKDEKIPMNKELLTTAMPATTIMPTSVTPPMHVDCPVNEDPQKPTLLPNPNDCSKFYKCVNRRGYLIACPAGLHFSTKLGLCDWPEVANCDASLRRETTALPRVSTTGAPKISTTRATTPAPSVPLDCPANEDPKNPIVLPYPGDCSKFYKCLSGRAYPIACPAGLHYSQKLEQCDWPENAKCDPAPKMSEKPSPSTKAPESKLILPGIEPKVVKCNGKTQLIAHNTDCTKFIQCVGNMGVEKSCPMGTHFNSQFMICDYPERANCQADTSRSKLPEKVVTEIPLTTRMPIDATTVPKREINQENICDGAADNSYLQHPQDCSKYVHCYNRQMFIQQCPLGLLWNHQLKNCDFKEKVDCKN
uniref:Venom polypeptide n=1 Tax=Dolopus genitalis TaxID=2488630 RepID=A0A3G5BIJ9_DOLGE|nr:venom polypeptide [Dolopus genitalis]